jgi:hypothetical protein
MRATRLKTFPRLWNTKLDEIKADDIAAYVGARQKLEMATSTINRDLATLRRMFKLAIEWETVSKLLPKVRLLPGGESPGTRHHGRRGSRLPEGHRSPYPGFRAHSLRLRSLSGRIIPLEALPGP